MQARVAGHDTPNKPLSLAPAGLGAGTMRQDEPFHASARARPAPPGVVDSPAAVHARAAGHDTAKNPVAGLPARLGVAWIRHVVPFQRSASGSTWSARL